MRNLFKNQWGKRYITFQRIVIVKTPKLTS